MNIGRILQQRIPQHFPGSLESGQSVDCRDVVGVMDLSQVPLNRRLRGLRCRGQLVESTMFGLDGLDDVGDSDDADVVVG